MQISRATESTAYIKTSKFVFANSQTIYFVNVEYILHLGLINQSEA